MHNKNKETMSQSSPEGITLGKGSTLQSLSLKINEEEVLKIPQLKRQAQKIEHKGTALTTEEVMEGRSSAYEFINFEELAYEAFKNESGDMSKYRARDLAIKLVKKCQDVMYTKEDMLEAFNAGNKRGHSGYPNTDNWTQPTFEDFISRKKETKTE